jgi:hypothetical protein
VSLLPVFLAGVAQAGGFALLQSGCLAQGAAPSADAQAAEPALIPMPREMQAGAVLSLAHGISIAAPGNDAEDLFTAADLADALKQRGVAAQENGKGEVRIVLLRETTKRAAEILAGEHIEFSAAMHDEGYALVTDGKTVYDIAATAAGMYYGAQTIKQLVVGRGGDAALQGATIRDWPAMKYRGISDDLSRGPIATLAFQEHEVQVLSEYKMNIYSPYFEVSLEYASSPLTAPPGGAMTRADVAELVSYAQKFHVTIVPEQEAFGHLHHALTFEKYSPLAETPHGSALTPGQPGSVELDKQWFGEIASMFPGPFIHIGADEVNEQGTGQSKELIAQNGAGKTYIGFLNQIYDALQPLHRKLLFWGDIAMQEPALVKTLPKDMIAIAWEYGPHPEGFDKWLRPFVDAGMETWVSPGINDWNRIYPNNYEGLLCIQGFVAEGQRVGSTGMLNTVWNTDEDDEGLFNNDWYGVMFGAAASWQAGTSSIPQFESTYGQVFHGDRTGKINQAQRELTAAQLSFRKGGSLHGAMTNLFWIDPWSEQGQIVSAKLMPMVPEIRLHAERAITLIKEAEAAEPLREKDALDAMELAARRMDFIGFKFQAAQEIAGAYNQAYREKNGKRSVGSPLFHEDYFYIDMVDGYGLLRDLYQQAWQRQNRPYTLDIVMAHYEMNIQLWLKRETLFTDAKSHFNQTQMLPKPEDVGMPLLAAEAGLPGK